MINSQTTKIYISGPITGIENYKENFNKAEIALVKLGFDVFNPANIPENDNWGWNDYMKICVQELTKCSHIILLDGWKESRGAQVEYSLADILGLKIIGECNLEIRSVGINE